MDRLKNRKFSSVANSSLDYTKRRSAHLNTDEVELDEWLDNDLGPNKKKQRFLTDNLFNQTDMKNKLSPTKSFASTSRRSIIDSSEDEAEPIISLLDDEKSSSVDAFDLMMNSKSKLPKKKLSSIQGNSKKMEQGSLLSAGFSRFFEGESSSAQPQSQPDSTSLTSLNERIRKKSIEKQIIIKVQVLDEKIIVPVGQDNDLKISWLIEETARRYYWLVY